jgi:recombination protein RecA
MRRERSDASTSGSSRRASELENARPILACDSSQSVARASKLPSARGLLDARSVPRGTPRFCLAELAGRLVEIAGWRASARFSFALALVVDAQANGETAVWVGPRSRSFFPPDAESAGVDLARLPVVRVTLAEEIPQAADILARSGAFGLLVLDVGSANVPMGVLSRLAGLARTHHAAVVLLTEKSPDRPSLGSVVSFRADASVVRASSIVDNAEVESSRVDGARVDARVDARVVDRVVAPSVDRSIVNEPIVEKRSGTFACELSVTRDRVRSLAWRHVEIRRGPPGLS